MGKGQSSPLHHAVQVTEGEVKLQKWEPKIFD